MSAFADEIDIDNINPFNTDSFYTYDDDYKMTHGLSSIDLITLITNINNIRNAEIKSSIDMINKSILNNEDSNRNYDLCYNAINRFACETLFPYCPYNNNEIICHLLF